MINERFDRLMDDLDEAYKTNNLAEISRINSIIMGDLEVSVSESTLDYDFIESIKGKTVHKTLKKFIKEGGLSKTDVLKLISSLTTHLIIESDVRGKDINLYPINVFSDNVSKLIKEEVGVDDVQKFLHSRYGRFI
jgi:hypothetical protein